ncbi:unnamed protein product [Peniophora sp. CBMAI 1063]|nr:unnamed protein product [Peniophora sp. CBMAI 1063]
MRSSKDFTIAIVGGGIVGLLCAIGLAQEGITVDVFEAAAKYGEIGAGIGIGANALRVLKDLGILAQIKARSESMQSTQNSIEFMRGTEPHNMIYEYPEQDDLKGLGFHRAAFLDILAGLLPDKVHSHFKKRCTSVLQDADERVRLGFSDGSEHVADLVIGADGIKSAIRAQVFGADGDRLVDTGTVAYRALVPVQRLRAAGVKEEFLKPMPRGYLGEEKHIIITNIMGGAVFNVAACTTDFARVMSPAGSQASWAAWVESASPAEILAAFSDFGPELRKIIEGAEGANKWAIHGLYPPLKEHVASAKDGVQSEDGGVVGKRNVVLIGDSAHAMLPHLGSGASVGIEDAYVLKSLLSHPQTERANLSDVLRAYSQVRVPRAQYVTIASKRAGDIYQGHGPSGPSDAQRRSDLDLQWDEIWRYDANEEVSQAVKILEEGGFFQHE